MRTLNKNKINIEDYVINNYQKALDLKHIQAHFQPVIRTLTCELCSFEALARWIDPVMGVIFPNEFIPVLERIKAIHLLDIAIVRQACDRIKKSMINSEPVIPISVNLSRLNFTLCDIFSIVNEIISEFKLPHDLIHFEITESIMTENTELMQSIVNKFRNAGYQVWMDDFGSAYSSLNVLKEIYFDELKLDMCFLRPFNQRSQRIAASIVKMAKDIDIHTLAEGVETQEQFEYLKNIGYEKVQGYLFGKPLPYDEAIQNLKEKGIKFEKLNERNYYDKIGMINVLSSIPFMSSSERNEINSAKRLNSIPLALIENNKDYFRILFYNTAFKNTAKGTGMFLIAFNQKILLQEFSYYFLSDKLVNLMDSTRSSEDGKMNFTSHEDYYEIKAKCISQTREKYCVLLSISNLSKSARIQNVGLLDDFLRQIYSLFERITLIDVKNDMITPLYTAEQENLVSSNTGLRAIIREFANKYIFPEDREKYLELTNLDTAQERFSNTGKFYMMKLFRTSVRHGQYAWKVYILLRISEDKYIMLIGDVNELITERLKSREKDFNQVFSPELLWRTLTQSGILRIFWKDIDRRFVGASQAFLDYYGFESLRDIIGKNDEDLGWHIHPDKYMNDELRVIHDGITTKDIPGWCINNGENREILASKTPFYDENGLIKGLLGYFIDRDMLNDNDLRGIETKRRDMLTGLLNSRGISEEASVFRDEYYLRGVDFVRIHISIEDINSINAQYGYDYGDKVLNALGNALKTGFGRTSAVGRYSGHKFVVLKQVQNQECVLSIRAKIKDIGNSIQDINGAPITLYLSVGIALFSDYLDLDEQADKAEANLILQ